jgi:hypothetical protein
MKQCAFGLLWLGDLEIAVWPAADVIESILVRVRVTICGFTHPYRKFIDPVSALETAQWI